MSSDPISEARERIAALPTGGDERRGDRTLSRVKVLAILDELASRPIEEARPEPELRAAFDQLRVVSVVTGPGPSVEGYIKADVQALLVALPSVSTDRRIVTRDELAAVLGPVLTYERTAYGTNEEIADAIFAALRGSVSTDTEIDPEPTK